MKSNSKINVDMLKFVARKFAILIHPGRIEIIKLLQENPGLSAKQIKTNENLWDTDTPTHLTTMKQYGMLRGERRGTNYIYSVNTDELEKIIKYSEELYHKEEIKSPFFYH
jgi:predicted transcriptional regulator